MKMGPSPSAGIEVAIGSFRPRSLASFEISEPMRPPPMTIVSAFSFVDIRADGRDVEGAKPLEVQMLARLSSWVSGDAIFIVTSWTRCCTLLLDRRRSTLWLDRAALALASFGVVGSE